ncbi:MAG TPA: ferredoxin--NADP reductase [Candidatus Acidoferrum sp.]|nr:ferredoxin--NADP reductase [Candidatus Acidoferrum sp.]
MSTQPAAEDIRSIVVAPETWQPHRPGQHYELRLPGGNVSRKYSVVSAPSRHGELEFGIQLIPSGELSPALWALKPGDTLEIRGPLGESFVLDTANPEPPVFIGAGSGITPLISMHRTYLEMYPNLAPAFIVTAKTPERIMHHNTLVPHLITRFTATNGRLNITFLAEKLMLPAANPQRNYYICGPPDFIDTIVDDLLELGVPEVSIKSERFI